ncbi:MAG: pyridoxal-phosphate dependent enzyme [Xanthomonadales bacterium]|nr:pyridoxal-phosphate dependent enzyme [Xanthomonadales bacterium]
MDKQPTLSDLHDARRRIQAWIHQTPVLKSRVMDELHGCQLYFKCENLQRTGAFKFRGASNAVLSLDDSQARAGVATHSSGNHGAALARAAGLRGIPCHVVVPDGAVQSKVEAIARYGGHITRCAPTQEAREQTLGQVLQQTGAEAVPPYNDFRVICGQGTAALELLEQVERLDLLMAPLGGGGLLSGCAIAGQGQVDVLGAEPAGADEGARSLAAGRILAEGFTPDTLCDGLRATIGPLTFAIISEQVRQVLTVSDEKVVASMQQLWRIMKIVVEPSAAIVLAAVSVNPDIFTGKRVGLILSGGNVDLDRLPWVEQPSA